jgi:hypothetical protein
LPQAIHTCHRMGLSHCACRGQAVVKSARYSSAKTTSLITGDCDKAGTTLLYVRQIISICDNLNNGSRGVSSLATKASTPDYLSVTFCINGAREQLSAPIITYNGVVGIPAERLVNKAKPVRFNFASPCRAHHRTVYGDGRMKYGAVQVRTVP